LIYNSFPENPASGISDAPQLDPDRFSVVYLGRIQDSKGVGVLYEAAKQLVTRNPQVDFYLAGEFSWRNPFAEDLIARNAKEELEKRIVFLGHIDDTTRLLEQAQLHVCPSISGSESFPNVILEAKKAGLPSVVFRTAGLPEAVQNEKEGLICEYKTVECLASCIERYIDEPGILRLHGQEARRSLRRYDEGRIQETWARLLRC